MSQLLQHNEQLPGPSNVQAQLAEFQFLPQDSPTVGRNQLPYTANNPSPTTEPGRRYATEAPSQSAASLKQTCADQNLSPRSQRKAAPSPLQTSTIPSSGPASVTPTRTTFRSGVDHTSSSPETFPQSPPTPPSAKECLDDLLASERSFYTSETSGDSSTERTTRYTRPVNETNEAPRSVSNPVLTSYPSGSPSTRTRPAMAATPTGHRVDSGRAPPRTSSIDSAISSHSKNSSQDMKSEKPDIANLVRAAGSPEALIRHLLDSKQSMSAQNTQLWRLVDKQRAMILGLNKDLDRAVKDRERYRKKFKELAAQQISNPSPVDSNPGVPSETGSITSTDSRMAGNSKPASMEALVSAGLRDPEQELHHSPIDVALAPYPITPPAMQVLPSLSNMVEAEHKMPSPTQHAFQQYNPDAPPAGFEAGQQQRRAEEVAREVPYNVNLPPSRSLPSDPPKGPPPSLPPPRAPMPSHNPSVTVIGPSPNPNEGRKSFPTPPPRKAPPAPLNLGKKNSPSSHLRQTSGAGEETDSDYDDILEVDELPVFTDRGRRKTREEDDREREIAAWKDAEIRSLSKKSGKGSKSRPTTPKEGKFQIDLDSMPISPRTIPIAPPENMRKFSNTESNAGSLAGVLSDASGVMSPPLLSPGLPMSPRPMDRPLGSPLPRNSSNQSSVHSPPMSPRGMGAFQGSVPLSPRAPRQPIPLPPNTPLSISSPTLKAEPLHLASPKPLTIAKRVGEYDESVSKDEGSPVAPSVSSRDGIYRGLVTDEYPDFLLPPNALPSIDVKVASSRLKPSRASMLFPKGVEEDPVFTLAVFARSDGRELWRVEKDSMSLANLDQFLKQSRTFTAKAPERSLFSGHAPAKVDARRVALDRYLDEMLNTQLDLYSALEICRYLSTNTMEPYAEDTSSGESGSQSPIKTGPGGRTLKNGFLTKRGKNFGGWKARYFVLDGPIFKYYDAPGGPNLGAIKLQNAQIGKQQQQADPSPSRGEDDGDNQYRHAFLILEPKRKDSSSLVRHVLCAESDQERDEWVFALMQYVDFKDEGDEDHAPHHGRTNSSGSGPANSTKSKKKAHTASLRSGSTLDLVDDDLKGVSYENTKPGGVPNGSRTKHSDTPSLPIQGHERDPLAQLPKNANVKNAQANQDGHSWGNRQNTLAPASQDIIKQRKRSFFGFGPKSQSLAKMADSAPHDPATNLSHMAYEQHGPIRNAFGASLGEAVRYNHPANVDIELPAVVYRCIEYLDAKDAANEEGIFRLSGSSVVIKALKERFNTEGDIDLVHDEQYYDIHAVASLLKQYLRELPQTILTRDLHLEFVAVTELSDMGEKVRALNMLVHRLPRANLALLRYLSGFLINIVNNSDRNKMTVRNVGIVFSPTLNIPQPVFALFLQQYDDIFSSEPDPSVEVTVTAPPLTPEDIRSPRHQKFQDLPTPSYDQQSFNPPPFPMPQHYQQRPQYDTGFAPMQPAYDRGLQAPTMAGTEYGRSTPTLAGPSYEQFAGNGSGNRKYSQDSVQSTKKRRESTMFGLNVGARRPSNAQVHDGRLVGDEEDLY